jgi:membrane-associated phospholipid phosphatase
MNNQIFYFFYSLAHKSAWLDNAITFFAIYFSYIVILFAAIFLLFYHRKSLKESLAVFYSGIFAWTLASIFKLFFHTQRPFDALYAINPLFSPTDYSFPSGHATFFFALASTLFFSHKKTGVLFFAFAILISMARVMAGVHFPIDILGGVLLGFAISFIIKKFIRV